MLSVPILWALLGAVIVFAAPISVWSLKSLIGVGMFAAGIAVVLYVIGMRVELDDVNLTKIYLFGRFRTSIPLSQLRASTERTESSGTSVTFVSANENGQSFSLLRTWGWRGRDINRLYRLAVAGEQKHPRCDLVIDTRTENLDVDPKKAYPVRLFANKAPGNAGPWIGQCRVRGANRVFSVEPEFEVDFALKDAGFYAKWDVDDAGVGHLREVILVTPT